MLKLMEIYTPLNSINWAIGSLVLFVFAFKNWRRYRENYNYLNINLAWFGLVLGVGLALTSYAEFFTTNVEVLHAFNLTSEIFIGIAFVIKSRLLWHMVLKGRVPYPFILVPATAVAVWGWVSNLFGSVTRLNPPFVDFIYAPGGVIAQNIMLGGIIIPIGLVFLAKGIQELVKTYHIKNFTKPFFIGLAYFGIAASTIDTNLESGGAETPSSAYISTFLFLMLLVVLLLPPLKRSKK